mgnify:CR=1 FL=1
MNMIGALTTVVVFLLGATTTDAGSTQTMNIPNELFGAETCSIQLAAYVAITDEFDPATAKVVFAIRNNSSKERYLIDAGRLRGMTFGEIADNKFVPNDAFSSFTTEGRRTRTPLPPDETVYITVEMDIRPILKAITSASIIVSCRVWNPETEEICEVISLPIPVK